MMIYVCVIQYDFIVTLKHHLINDISCFFISDLGRPGRVPGTGRRDDVKEKLVPE